MLISNVEGNYIMPDTCATKHSEFKLHLDDFFFLEVDISKNVHCQDDNASRWTRC